jgi:transcriptional regulator with XRE-family HTH domain
MLPLPGPFAERLQRAISDAKITQSNVARLVNVTQPAVSGWLSGDKVPTPDKLDALARALGVNVAWLASGQGRMRAADPEADRAAYREQALWWFRPAPPDGGRDYGNANIWSFDVKLEALVREVLQNARDAATSPDQCVNVVFRIIRLTGDDLRAYREALHWTELLSHLSSSSTGQQKLATLIRDGLRHVEEKSELLLLCIEDAGTTGLIGPEKDTGKFTALCRNNLDSNKDDAGTKGGAFGLGKAVLWRASRLSAVLFCSHLSRPENGQADFRLLGRCELPWHQTAGAAFAGPGWFGRRDDEGQKDALSFWENQTLARDLYLDREGSGTTACVVGFHDAESDQERKPVDLADDLVKSAAEHFFPALFFGTLSVRVEVCDGRRQYDLGTPGYSRQVNVDELQPHYCRMLRAVQDGTTAEALKENGEVVCKRVTLTVSKRTQEPKHPEKEHPALLLVANAGDDSPKEYINRLAMFRGPGMVIETVSLAGLALGARPFHGLLLCGRAPTEAGVEGRDASADEAAEEFLRTAEPPSHNKWIATAELKAIYFRGCKSRLEEFLAEVRKEIAKLVKPAPRDLGNGPNSLRELFRIGNEPAPTDRPRVTQQSGSVDEQGRWVVEATIRLKSRKTPVRLEPAVYFQVETGSPQPVEWLDLEGVSNCAADGLALLVPADKRELKFKGITNADSHPAPAGQSCVVVDVRKITALKGSQP